MVKQGDELHTVKKAEAAQAASPLMFDGQKLMPSVTRVFSKTQGSVRLPAGLRAQVRRRCSRWSPTSRSTAARKKRSKRPRLPITEGIDPKSKAIPIRFTVPLQNMPTGRYDVQVSVLEPQGQKAAFWQAPIVVVP